jgi:hypothetical protein
MIPESGNGSGITKKRDQIPFNWKTNTKSRFEDTLQKINANFLLFRLIASWLTFDEKNDWTESRYLFQCEYLAFHLIRLKTDLGLFDLAFDFLVFEPR